MGTRSVPLHCGQSIFGGCRTSSVSSWSFETCWWITTKPCSLSNMRRGRRSRSTSPSRLPVHGPRCRIAVGKALKASAPSWQRRCSSLSLLDHQTLKRTQNSTPLRPAAYWTENFLIPPKRVPGMMSVNNRFKMPRTPSRSKHLPILGVVGRLLGVGVTPAPPVRSRSASRRARRRPTDTRRHQTGTTRRGGRPT
jgi:hypothetical protein